MELINIIIDNGISAPGNGIDFVDGLNDTYKRFIFQLEATVQLPGIESIETKMLACTVKRNSDVSLSLGFQKHLSNALHKHGVLDRRREKTIQ